MGPSGSNIAPGAQGDDGTGVHTREALGAGPGTRRGARLAIGLGLAGWMAALTTGCGHQVYEPRPPEPAEIQTRWLAADPDDPALREPLARLGVDVSAWPLPAWDLTALTGLALQRHPELAVARASLRGADAARAAVRLRAGRSVETTLERHSATGSSSSPWSLGLVLDGLVPAGTDQAARSALADEADALADEAVALAAQTAWEVRQRVRNRQRELFFATQRREAAQGLLQSRRELRVAQEGRLARGAVSALEPLQAKLAEAEAEAQLDAARDGEVRARLALAEAVALPLAALQRLTLRFGEALAEPIAHRPVAGPATEPAIKPATDPAGLSKAAGSSLTAPAVRSTGEGETAALQRAALLHRLDLRAALARHAAAEAALRVEIARQWPGLVLKPGYAWDQGDNRWSIGLAFSLPPGGDNRGPIEQARARRELEAERITALQQAALARLDAAAQAVQAATARCEAATAARRGAQEVQRRILKRLASGDADRLEVLAAQLAKREAAYREVDAEAARWAALGELEDALQRPLDGVLTEPPAGPVGSDMPTPPRVALVQPALAAPVAPLQIPHRARSPQP